MVVFLALRTRIPLPLFLLMYLTWTGENGEYDRIVPAIGNFMRIGKLLYVQSRNIHRQYLRYHFRHILSTYHPALVASGVLLHLTTIGVAPRYHDVLYLASKIARTPPFSEERGRYGRLIPIRTVNAGIRVSVSQTPP